MNRFPQSICAGFFAVTGAAQEPRAPEPAGGVPGEVQTLAASLNENWLKRDAKAYAGHFSEDTDWENAFGWRIQGRARLEEFLRTYLWSSTAPRRNRQVMHGYRTKALSADTVIIEGGSELVPADQPNATAPTRVTRRMHILSKQRDKWQIIFTRIWDPRADSRVPTDRFQEFRGAPGGAPFYEMRASKEGSQ